jgi:hypothetical protein
VQYFCLSPQLAGRDACPDQTTMRHLTMWLASQGVESIIWGAGLPATIFTALTAPGFADASAIVALVAVIVQCAMCTWATWCAACAHHRRCILVQTMCTSVEGPNSYLKPPTPTPDPNNSGGLAPRTFPEPRQASSIMVCISRSCILWLPIACALLMLSVIFWGSAAPSACQRL